jgi:hypothetical protein
MFSIFVEKFKLVMKKFSLFTLLATVLLVTGCEGEMLDQEIKKPIVDGRANITIMGDSMVITRSTGGRVEFAGGYATGAGLYDGGGYAEVEAVPYSGYQLVSFTGGKVNGNLSQYAGSSQYGFKIEQSDWRFSVTFKKEYTISVSAGSGGSASGSRTVLEGENCTVNASAYSGYTFDGWYEEGSKVSSSASYTFTVSSNRTSHVFLS